MGHPLVNLLLLVARHATAAGRHGPLEGSRTVPERRAITRYPRKVDRATLLGLLLGVLGVLVGIVSIWIARRPKRLGFSLDLWLPLLSETYPGLEVKYQGTRVERPHLFVFRYKNYGKVEIRADDFDSENPLTLLIGPALVDAAVAGGEKRVQARIEKTEHQIVVQPTLINPGEEIRVTGLADLEDADETPTFKVLGRLAGVAEIRRLDGVGRWATLERPVGFLSLIVASLVAFLVGSALGGLSGDILLTIGVALILLTFIPDIVRWYRRRQLR